MTIQVDANKSGSIIYLNFSIPFSDSVAIVCFVKDSPEEFRTDDLSSLAGKRVRARGIFEEYKGAFQLRLRRLSDLSTVE